MASCISVRRSFLRVRAFVIGAISLRTTGVFFLMITLAFSQMVYFLAIERYCFRRR